MITIKDLKSKASSTESDGVYIMPFNPKYEKDELEERMLKVVEEQPSVALRFLCLIGDYKVGTSKQYISQIIDSNDIPSLGESMLIASPTGSGKTSAVIKMIKHTSMPVIYVTNRKMTLCQFKKDYIKASKGLDVPAELLDSISLGENIIAITYQELAETTYKYKSKKYLLILDEVHCLLEDANFSVYAEKIIRYLKANRDNTARQHQMQLLL